jgi:hypothetical protein
MKQWPELPGEELISQTRKCPIFLIDAKSFDYLVLTVAQITFDALLAGCYTATFIEEPSTKADRSQYSRCC